MKYINEQFTKITVPNAFCCSLANMGLPMIDPVITSFGNTYERKYIEKWLIMFWKNRWFS